VTTEPLNGSFPSMGSACRTRTRTCPWRRFGQSTPHSTQTWRPHPSAAQKPSPGSCATPSSAPSARRAEPQTKGNGERRRLLNDRGSAQLSACSHPRSSSPGVPGVHGAPSLVRSEMNFETTRCERSENRETAIRCGTTGMRAFRSTGPPLLARIRNAAVLLFSASLLHSKPFALRVDFSKALEEKREHVGVFVYLFRDRFAAAMARLHFGSDQYRAGARSGFLKPSRKLPSHPRIDAIICIRSHHECRGVGHTVLDIVIRRIPVEVLKLFSVFR